MRDRTGGSLEAAGMEDGGPATPIPDGEPAGPPSSSRPDLRIPGAMNRARPPVSYPNQRAAGKAFAEEIKANPKYEAAVVVDRRDGTAKLIFGDESACDVPIGEHLEQVKHYHPGLGVKTDIGHRTPSFDDIEVLHGQILKGGGSQRSMIRWNDAGGVPHWTPYGIDTEAGVVWVRVPGAPRKEFNISILENRGQGKYEYLRWVDEVSPTLPD
jgi:hypothetical protein